jgi:hypothetical protein
LGTFYTWPLLPLAGSRLAGSLGDSLLNTSVLWWNATTLPFSAAWWNQPQFYPCFGVTTFTENLLGISVLASPIYWLSGSPIVTYNLSVFLTWPLSAFTAHLLAWWLSGRRDVGLIAGIAYGFSTYRPANIGQIQMLASFWMPLVLLGLHGYLRHRSRSWLILFGVAWLLQSLANGHLMLFGGVLIGLWLLYFCSPRDRWRDAAVIAVAWAIASVPLMLVMLKYLTVHQHYGVARNLEVVGLSAPLHAWATVADSVWLWARWLLQGPDSLFPGLTAALLVAIGLGAALLERRRDDPPASIWHRRLIVALWIIFTGSTAVIVAALLSGPLHVSVAGVSARVTDLTRPLALAAISGAMLVRSIARTRVALQRRSTFMFYAFGILAMGLFAMGPVMQVNDTILFHHAPYRWLLDLPGFNSVRGPQRFWMLGVLCLSIAAGLAFARLRLRTIAGRRVAALLIAGGMLLDGWLAVMPMENPPANAWPAVERRGVDEPPLLELPMRDLDFPATYRAMGHRRRVINGTSGYDPPHYDILADALSRFDSDILKALASLGSFDAVIDRDLDHEGRWERFVAQFPGVRLLATEGPRVAYRVDGIRLEPIRLGPPLPIRGVQANDGYPDRAVDGTIATGWDNGPQNPRQWLQFDLQTTQDVAGVTLWLGAGPQDYPRRLAIDVTADGISWTTVWEGSGAGPSFLAAIVQPREKPAVFAFPAAAARAVRLRQLADHHNLWFVAEAQIHAPAR